MSVSTWNKEYGCLTILAAKIIGRRGRKSTLIAAMRKLEGLKVSNLNRHQVIVFNNGAEPDGVIDDIRIGDENKSKYVFSTETCPACRRYRDDSAIDQPNAGCDSCPVFKKSGKTCYAPDGFMRHAVKSEDFSKSRATLRQWWKEWYPDTPLPEFKLKAVEQGA
jgi:hypothetical protein